jgi:hypothetical protein
VTRSFLSWRAQACPPYDIPLARPRGLGARSHPHFIEATTKITELFLSKGILRGEK